MPIAKDCKNRYADVMEEIMNIEKGRKRRAGYRQYLPYWGLAQTDLIKSGKWDWDADTSDDDCSRLMFKIARERLYYIARDESFWTKCAIHSFPPQYVLFECDLFTPTGKKPTTNELYQDMMTYERFDAFLTEDTLNSICEDVLGEILTFM